MEKQLDSLTDKDPLFDHHKDLTVKVLSRIGCTIRLQIFKTSDMMTKTDEYQKQNVWKQFFQ